MKTRFNHAAYRLRGQVETVISMLKRNFGSALRAKSDRARRRDLRLKVLTHNIALALLQVFYRAVVTLFPFFCPASRRGVAAISMNADFHAPRRARRRRRPNKSGFLDIAAARGEARWRM
jgi:hypothetical protein